MLWVALSLCDVSLFLSTNEVLLFIACMTLKISCCEMSFAGGLNVVGSQNSNKNFSCIDYSFLSRKGSDAVGAYKTFPILIKCLVVSEEG